MCGLIGLISNSNAPLSTAAIELFIDSLKVGVLRGDDSTGLFIVTKAGNVHTLKYAQNSTHFLEHPTTIEFFKEHSDNILAIVGHNRAATKGNISDETAHPFIHNNIVLVHNGTLLQHKTLADVDVDSEAICHAISKTDYKKVLPQLNGAFALIWYNAQEKQLYVTRNKERPLWIFSTSGFDYICSEQNMGNWLLQRTFKYNKNPEGRYFKELEVYNWEIDKLSEGFSICHQYTEEKNFFFHPTKTQSVVGNIGIKKLPNLVRLLPEYDIKKDQLLRIFIVNIDELKSGPIKITGYISEYPDVTFLYYITVSEEEKNHIYQHDTITGKVFGCDTNKKIIYLLKPVNKIIRGINNITVEFDEDTKCYKCNTTITTEDNNKVYIKQKQNQTKILCPHCVNQIPQLKEKYVLL